MLTSGVLSAGNSGLAGGAPDPRLKPAAHEFEACLMKEFLEPLQHDALFADEKDQGSGAETGEGSQNALMSFGSEALAKAISERGGFGIASKIIGHFGDAKKTAVKESGQI
jgi:peptidoglycan hydrolase FlgJ